MWRALAVLVILSVGVFAALTVWTNRTTAATHATSRRFTQEAKAICDHAPHTPAGLREAADRLSSLAEPPNVHRAVARLQLHWRRLAGTPTSRAEKRQVRLSAHLLGISDCMSVVPR
jgi:hypothetical protein